MVIVIKNNQGGVTIVRGPYEEEFGGAKEYLKHVSGDPLYSHCEWRETSEANIPSDKTFRNAWTDDNPGEKVGVDKAKIQSVAHAICRENHLNELIANDIVDSRMKLSPAQETIRDSIGDKYIAMQAEIDKPNPTEAKLKTALGL